MRLTTLFITLFALVTGNIIAQNFVPVEGTVSSFNHPSGGYTAVFDPGGPGGDFSHCGAAGPITGNYPNCGCATTITICPDSPLSPIELDFFEFDIFANFDYLIIYDNNTATGTELFNNGSGGLQNGDYCLPVNNYTATNPTGCLTLYFMASTVVDYGGFGANISGGIPPTPCSGLPTAGTAMSNPSVACAGSSIALSLNGTSMVAGLEYQWQSAPSVTGPWTDIPTAINATYTTTQTSTTYYRAEVTCTSSGQTDVSLPVEVISLSPLNGPYTIDASLPASTTNFLTFSDAAFALNCVGISGPVIFNVAPGTYVENIALDEIVGASAINTITFNGGDMNDVLLTSNAPATILFNETDHVILKNMTIENLSQWGVHLYNDADSISIDSCYIRLPYSVTANLIGVVASGSLTSSLTVGNSDGITISNTQFFGGEKGIHLEGATAWSMNNKILSCEFSYHDDEAIEVDQQDGLEISANKIFDMSGFALGFRLVDLRNFTISRNNINVDENAILITNANEGYVPTSNSKITNNLVFTQYYEALYLTDGFYIDIHHNTLVGGINDADNHALLLDASHDYLDIRNNIFACSGTNAVFESDDPMTANDVLNYNDYYHAEGGPLARIALIPYTDLASWTTADPQFNANSISAQPNFYNISLLNNGVDIHILSGPTVNAGDLSIGINVDVDGDPRPLGLGVDLGADEITQYNTDLKLVSVLTPGNGNCANSDTYLEVKVHNTGSQALNNVPFTVEISGAMTSTTTQTITASIAPYSFDTVLLGPIDMSSAGLYDITVYTTLASDQDASNDTISKSFELSGLVSGSGPAATGGNLCPYDDTTYVFVNNPVGNTIYSWYKSPASLTPIETGESLQVANLIGTTNFYVSSTTPGTIDSVGPIDNTIGATGFFLSTTYGVNFTAHSALIIDSVTVFPQGSGNLEILLRDFQGTPVVSKMFYIDGTSASVTLNLNMSVQAGDYTLIVGGNSDFGTLSLSRNSSGANYPYTVPGVISLTSNQNTAGYFYNFYNWQIRTLDCESERTLVEVTVDPYADLGLPGDTTICPEMELSLDPGNVFASYEWQDGSSGSTFNVAQAGQYVVTVTTANGCTSEDSVEIMEHPSYDINIGDDQAVCEGKAIFTLLNAGPGFSSYEWNDNSSGQTLTATSPGTYSVTVTNSIGCTASDSLHIIGLEGPNADAGPDVSMCDGEPIAIESGGMPEKTWLNLFGEEITGEITGPGVYFLRVTDANGCSSIDTLIVDDCLGFESAGANGLVVYPNPAGETLHLEFGEVSNVDIKVYDVYGRMVIRLKETGTARTTLNTSTLAAGQYIIRADINGSITQTRVVVR